MTSISENERKENTSNGFRSYIFKICAKVQNYFSCYQNGTGVEDDEQTAVERYQKAAEQGDADAQHSLGWCYSSGTGVEKDEQKAVEWYQKAAKQGYAQAQYNLGVCYQHGSGVKKDEQKAFEWYQKAAEEGYIKAQNLIYINM